MIEAARDELELMVGDPMTAISSCLRGMIVPAPGNDFIGVDFASIEARITAWISGQENRLREFEAGIDPYIIAASKVYQISINEVTKSQRQVGKVAVLAFGFGGGKGAFKIMGKTYGVKVTDTQAESIKVKWRNANPNIVQMWYQLEAAAIKAVQNPRQEIKCGMVSYTMKGSFLLCKLPSGREICYPYPKLGMKKTPWNEMKLGVSAKWVDSLTKKWTRRHLWYGILMENIVQAIARDILASTLLYLENEINFEIVAHIHDEVLIEIEEKISSVEYVIQMIYNSIPPWCEGLPIHAEGWRGKRYQK